jgi:hypothetical protein
MSTIEEIKTAVTKVSRQERRELQRWLQTISEGEPWTDETLRHEIELGLKDLEEGRYRTYDEAGLHEEFERIKLEGRRRLALRQGKQPDA